MRAFTLILAGALSVYFPESAGAQPISRTDFTGLVGWFNANKSGIASDVDNGWYNRSAYGAVMLGWYWTDHLKSEVEFGVSSPAELYALRTISAPGQTTYTRSEHRFSTRRVTAGQQYQFFRNAWAHPHVGAGVDLTWERHEEEVDPIYFYDSVARTTRVIADAETIGPSIDFRVRPFAEVGTKLYFGQRGFFRTDLRLTFRDRVEEVIIRFGFGVDF